MLTCRLRQGLSRKQIVENIKIGLINDLNKVYDLTTLKRLNNKINLSVWFIQRYAKRIWNFDDMKIAKSVFKDSLLYNHHIISFYEQNDNLKCY